MFTILFACDFFYSFSCQIILWDISEHAHRMEVMDILSKTVATPEEEQAAPVVRYTAVSSIEAGHRTCITDLQWLPPCMEVW